MPDERERDARLRALLDARGDALDEALCAWIDGELEDAEAALLQGRARAEPAVAARRRELEAVDHALGSLPLPEISPGLRAKLQERIDAVAGAAGGSASRGVVSSSASLRRSVLGRRWIPAAAAALAAGLALYFATVGPRPISDAAGRSDALQLARRESAPAIEATGQPRDPGSPEALQVAPPATQSVAEVTDPLAAKVASRVARLEGAATGDQQEPDSGLGGTGLAAADARVAPDPVPTESEALLAATDDIADGELAIAFELDELLDFEVIDRLELLERLAELDVESIEGQGAATRERG